MYKKESSGKSGVQAPPLFVDFDVPEHLFRQDEDQQPVQKMQAKVDEVITPDLLTGPDIVQRERQV